MKTLDGLYKAAQQQRDHQQSETYRQQLHPRKQHMASYIKRTSINTDESHGMLLQDLSSDSSHLLFEFKPKWFGQSIDTPEGWKSCRTCALRRARASQVGPTCLTLGKSSLSRYCPFDLTSGDSIRILRAVAALNDQQQVQLTSEQCDRISRFLQHHSLLAQLVQLHRTPEITLSLADMMTLRDITVYIRVPRDSEQGELHINIGDLDQKSKESRKGYWYAIERMLCDEGWYMGRGMQSDEEDCRY